MLKKKTGFAWNLHRPLPSPLQAECVKGVFQIKPPISCVSFSYNMSIPKARVNISENEHDTTFETNFWIYSVQITGKCICEIPPTFA